MEAQYLRARWYDVAKGRFTQRDKWPPDIATPLSFHDYLYVVNNPLNWLDPTGYKPDSIDQVGEIDIDQLVHEGTLNVCYQYSCNCGWIDWAHALSGMQSQQSLAYKILKPLKAQVEWDRYPTAFRSRVVVVRSWVGFKGLFKVPTVTDYALIPEENLSTKSQRYSIAASVFVEHSMNVEQFHDSFGRFSDSGFSEEDLPSNLIGLYMTLQIENGTSYRDALKEVFKLCNVTDEDTSKAIYRDVYKEGALFIEGWRRWDARLIPIIMSDPCRFSNTCLAPRTWPTQFSDLYHRAKEAKSQGLWRWLRANDPGDFVLTDVENLLLLRPYRIH